MAHTFFMQDNHYKEAIRYYEPIVKKNVDNLLSVTAIVLANLCVSYIMTSQVSTPASPAPSFWNLLPLYLQPTHMLVVCVLHSHSLLRLTRWRLPKQTNEGGSLLTLPMSTLLSQNEEAEELMRKVEKEEERVTMQTPDKQCFHLCIINLVIGTLYCAKVGGPSAP